MESLSNTLHYCNYLAEGIIEWDCKNVFLYLMLFYFLMAELKMMISAKF